MKNGLYDLKLHDGECKGKMLVGQDIAVVSGLPEIDIAIFSSKSRARRWVRDGMGYKIEPVSYDEEYSRKIRISLHAVSDALFDMDMRRDY